MNIKNRILGMETVLVKDLVPHASNWRTHSKKQQDTLKGLLAEVGYAVPIIAHRLPDGRLRIIDGHLRAETLPDSEVSVVVLDVTEEEADKLLLTIDPLAGLAGQDDAKIAELLAGVHTDSAAVQEMLSKLYKLPEEGGPGEAPPAVQEKFEILITCSSEAQQAELLERFAVEGIECRSLIS